MLKVIIIFMEITFKESYCNLWFDFILENNNEYKNFDFLSKHPLLTWSIFLKYSENIKFKWIMKNISSHPMITWDLVKNNPQFEWNYNYLALNENITWREIISKNLNKFTDFFYISQNNSITSEDIEENLDLNWDWNQLSKNRNLNESR